MVNTACPRPRARRFRHHLSGRATFDAQPQSGHQGIFLKDYFSRNETTAHVTCSTGSTREMAETYRRKFIKEAQLQLQMHHPNLVDIYDIFEEHFFALLKLHVQKY